MKTSKYQTPESRKAAKRVSRHPAYQDMRARALAGEKDAAYWRADAKRLASAVTRLQDHCEAQRVTIAELKGGE